MLTLDFSNKNCIVTGGASGIGKATVEGIVEGGGKVAIVDINEEAANEVIAALGKENVSFYEVDLNNTDQIRIVFNKIIEEMGKIDVLINNAGIVSTKKFMDIDQAEWDRVMRINMTSIYATVQTVFPSMMANNYGRIVYFFSVAVIVGLGLLGTCVYATSKAAVLGFTKAIAKEGAKHNISCCAVCPSYTETAMTTVINGPIREKVLSAIPLGRPAKPSEIANLILFYASDLASFITGEIGDADGGLTLD